MPQTLLLLLAPLLTNSDDWTGWRGPHGDGIASGSPPIEWSETKNVRWKAALPGGGLSQPIVLAERVFLTCAVGTGKTRMSTPDERNPEPREIEEQEFSVLAFERRSGKELWRKLIGKVMPHEPKHPENTYATPTPVTDGKLLYVSFGSFGIHALTPAGELVWQVDLGDMTNQGHGEGSSPILYGDSLIVQWAHWGASYLIALDAANGKERWRSPLSEGNNCSTPLVARFGDEDQIVVGGFEVCGIDPRNGKRLWSFGVGESRGFTAMASPIVAGELVLIPGMSPRTGFPQLRAVFVDPESNSVEELWSLRSDDNIPSPIEHHGRFVYLKGEGGILSLLDSATGELEYGPERLESTPSVWASPILVGDRLYVVGRDGKTSVLALAPEVTTLAVNELDDHFDASPASAGGELYLRGRTSLYCLAEPSAK
ncbi:MAG: PQQ-binding-like beta-propeller repeat protein [Planctomycetota bacterium]